MSDRGFAAVVSAIERTRDSLNSASDRLVFVMRDATHSQFTGIEKFRDDFSKGLTQQNRQLPPDRDKAAIEERKQTQSLDDLRITLKRLLSRTYWTGQRAVWQFQKATRPAPTEVEIAEKRYRNVLKRTPKDERAEAVVFGAATNVFLAKLKELLEKSFPKKNPVASAAGTVLKAGAIGAAFPFVSVLFGGFKKVGEEIAADFSKRLAGQMQATSKIDFGAMGGDVGQAVGSGLQKGVLDFAAMVEESIASEGNEVAPKLGNLFGKIFDNLVMSVSKAGLALPRGYQRMQFQRLALPQIKEQAGRMMIDNPLSDDERDRIGRSQSISLVVGGVNMDETAGNTDYVERLMGPLLQGSHVVPIKNEWSNAPYEKEFKTQFQNLVKTALNTPVLGDEIIRNIQETNQKMGEDSDFKDIKPEDFADRNKISSKLIEIVGNKDMPVGKGIEAIFKGYNPDDVKIAATAMYYRSSFPDKPVNIIGTSFGGFNAAGASQMLEMMGVQGIKGAGITTPFTGIMSPPNEEDFLGSIGTKDHLFQAVEKLLGEFDLNKEFQQVIEGAGIGHLLPLFMGDGKFQGRFQELMKGRLQFKPGIDESSVNYFSKRYQNPEDGNLIRTVQGLAGEKYDEGYIYNAEDLKGYTKEIKKKSKRVSNPQLKQEIDAYLEFLGALIEDLETIGALKEFGINTKPNKSIEKGKKAIAGFPEIATDNVTVSQEGKSQIQAFKNLIAFRQKLRGEFKNLNATLTAMQGQIPKEGWSFFDGGDGFDDKFQALENFTDWLENDLLKDASEVEKKLAKPFLDFMKKLSSESQKLKGGGGFDSSLSEEFESLFGSSGEINKSLQLSGQNIQKYYAIYLTKIVEEAKQNASEQIRAIVPNYEGLAVPEKRDLARSFNREIQQDAAQFRGAIERGDRELARSVGEGLLKKIQSIKKIYADLIDRTEDTSGRRSMQGQVSYLSAVEREIIEGQPNRRGMADTGLTQLVSEAASSGDRTTQGFIQSVNSDVGRAIGLDFARGVGEGTREGLDIQSPSKVFEEIGSQVVAGFEQGIADLEKVTLSAVEGAVVGADRGIASFIDSARQGFSEFFDDLLKRFPVLKELTNLLLGLGAGLLVGQIFESLVGWLTEVANASFGAVVEFESLIGAMESITGSSDEAASGLAYIRSEAKKLGIDLKTAEEAYAGFKATTRFSPLQGSQGDRIFSTFAQTASLRGLTGEQQSKMFAALNQAFSKEKLSEEEITGQMGEIPALAFKQTFSRALGVSTAQLSKMIGSGQLTAQDVFPKVAAQYAAENAAIANSSETTAQAVNRLNNAVLNLQRAFSDWIAPAKNFFNAFASGVELISNLIPGLVKVLSILTAQLLLDNLIAYINWFVNLKTVAAVVTNTFKSLASFLNAFRAEILSFLKTFALMTLAFDAVGAAINVMNNAFPELQKSISETTNRANQLKTALLGVANAGKNVPSVRQDLPTDRNKVTTSKTWNLLGIQTPFNLEKPRQWLGLNTLGNKELSDFQVGVGDLVMGVDQTLSKQFDTEKVLEDIKKIDKELTTIRSRRFNISAGDKDAYQKSIEAEQKLLEKRDTLLKVTAQFQQNLESDRATVDSLLKQLDELAARKGITSMAETSIRAVLENRLADIDKTKSTFEDLVSTLAKSVNALELALRNMNEQAAYFNETLERTTSDAKTGIINSAIASGQGSQATDLALQGADRNTLSARLIFLSDQFEAVNELLERPDFEEIVTELKSQAEDLGLNLENTATLDRLIAEGRSQQETAVLNALKQQLELKGQIAGTQEQLAQSTLNAKNSLFDLNKAVEDYFFNLSQQILEAQNEVQKLIAKLKYGDIKSKLSRALVPGSDTFINGIISQIQGLFDQAAQLTEQIFGSKAARIQFGSEKYSLQSELLNFTRNLGGATEAILAFTAALNGQSNVTTAPQPSPSPVVGGGAGHEPLLKLIRSGEGSWSSANRGNAGDTPGGLQAIFGKTADQMTVGEIIQAQSSGKVFAVGAYQFIPSTLKQAVEDTGIALTTLFNKQTQDILAISLLYKKRPQIGRYLSGKSDNLLEAAQDMAREWAAIGLTYAEAGRGVGSSRYAGTGRNAASITPQQVQAVLQQTRRNLSKSPSTPANTNIRTSQGLTNPVPSVNRLSDKHTYVENATRPGGTAHKGIDIFAPVGTPIVSPVSGSLVYAKQGGTVNGAEDSDPSTPGKQAQHSILIKLDKPIVFENKKIEYAYLTHLRNLDSNIYGKGTDFNKPMRVSSGQALGEMGVAGGQSHLHIGLVGDRKQVTYLTEGQMARLFYGGTNNLASSQTITPDNTKAQQQTGQFIDLRGKQLDLNDAADRQAVQDFILQLNQDREAIKRQGADNIRTTQNTIRDLENQAKELEAQYSPPTQTSQREAELRGLGEQYRQFDNQLFEQERSLSDTIRGIDALIEQSKPVIELLKSSNNEVDRESAKLLQGVVDGLKGDRATYSSALEKVQGLRKSLKEGKKDAEEFVRLQAEFRAAQAELERIGQELAIAQGTNNLELERTVALTQSRKQLEVDIAQISQDFADNPEEMQRRIDLASQQAQLREKEIEYQYQSKKLSQEIEKINTQLSLAQSNSNLEKKKELELLQSQKQLEQEILDLKNQYPDPTEQANRIGLAQQQRALRDRQIEFNYENDQLGRRQQNLDYDSQIAEASASKYDRFGLTFFGDRIREKSAIAQENFRYEQETTGIRQQYADDPRTADELLSKAEILHNLNLDGINQQFRDLGETIADVAGDAFTGFVDDLISGSKSIGEAFADMAKGIIAAIAKIIVQMLVMKAVQAVFGGFGGSSVAASPQIYSGFPSTPGAIYANTGGLITGPGTGTSDSIRTWLSNGEFVFSADAVQYWGENLLHDLNAKKTPKLSLSSLGGQNNNSYSGGGNRTVNIHTTVLTPNADSFNKSDHQTAKENAEMARRALIRS